MKHIPLISTSLAVALVLTGCAPLGEKLNGKTAAQAGAEEQVAVTETPKPEFSAKQVPPTTAQSPFDTVTDEGLGVEWQIRSVRQGPTGGAQILIRMKNLNKDFAVPPSAIGDPTLSSAGGNVALMQVPDQGLDAPLGALAETTISYTFNTSPWNLSNAELKLGNAVFKGYLSR
ncbi:hypothetical protein HW450_11275 [Corynebacterium hindlerae]|uniref:Uncharacterized protein n=1 Tax=Corynebacterium hindlerae TaxID=699041 RepID=A0A7G5FE64_9CORY|nr:hypothetical protein [Corynebacterium hindlerae]QMV84905.1 hypothetical protein HW450_11275 [Corynebacterium hindlerae]